MFLYSLNCKKEDHHKEDDLEYSRLGYTAQSVGYSPGQAGILAGEEKLSEPGS